jgi:hypothetical protein
MTRRRASNHTEGQGKGPTPRTPKALVEYLKAAEPLDEDFPEIEDFPPERATYFDDFEDEPAEPAPKAGKRSDG